MKISSFVIAILLTIFVAFVQSDLDEKPSMSEKLFNTTKWTSMTESTFNITVFTPQFPRDMDIDAQSVKAARDLACNHGIESISFGKSTEFDGPEPPFIYPNCFNSSSFQESPGKDFVGFHYKKTSYEVVFMKEKRLFYHSVTSDTMFDYGHNWTVVVPYPSNGFNFSISHFSSKTLEECYNRNVSTFNAYSFVSGTPHNTQRDNFTAVSLSTSLFNEICRMHKTIEMYFDRDEYTDLKQCVKILGNLTSPGGKITEQRQIDHECISEKRSSPLVNFQSISLSDVGAIIGYENDRGVACTNATVRYDFLAIPDYVLHDQFSLDTAFLSYSFEVVSGECELVYDELGLTSIVFASYSEWIESESEQLVGLSRRQKYHCYMMQIARDHFQFDQVFFQIEQNNKSFMISENKTYVNIGFSFIMAAIISIFLMTVTALNIILHFFLPKHVRVSRLRI